MTYRFLILYSLKSMRPFDGNILPAKFGRHFPGNMFKKTLEEKMSEYPKRLSSSILISVTLLVASITHADDSSQCSETSGCADLNHHAAYWETKIKPDGSLFSVTMINDIYFEPTTRRMTVYTQSRAFGRAVAPAQIPRGDCVIHENETYCSHPSAVYLTGSGKELTDAEGSGSWWMRQSWVVNGEGFTSSEIRPEEHYSSTYMTAELMEDGLTIKVGNPELGFSLRRPIYNGKRVIYDFTVYAATATDSGELSYEESIELQWQCKNEKSPLTGRIRSCPSRM